MEPIFDLNAVKAELEKADPQENPSGFPSDPPIRSVFLGTVCALTPSGKYYMPWACSNVDLTGHPQDAEPPADGCECEACRDAIWYEQAEKELESIGAYLESGEGDPCDLFATRADEEGDNNA